MPLNRGRGGQTAGRVQGRRGRVTATRCGVGHPAGPLGPWSLSGGVGRALKIIDFPAEEGTEARASPGAASTVRDEGKETENPERTRSEGEGTGKLRATQDNVKGQPCLFLLATSHLFPCTWGRARMGGLIQSWWRSPHALTFPTETAGNPALALQAPLTATSQSNSLTS